MNDLKIRRLLVSAAAVLAPFYFVFPGTLWEEASAADRRVIRRCAAAGAVLYLVILLLLFG